MFVSPAYAQAIGGESGQALVQFLPLVLIFVVFYFLLIRPQQKRAKETKAMLEALRRGDRVVTGGGIVGTVAKVVPNSDEVLVDIADNVRVRVLRATISNVLARTEPVAGGKDKEEAGEAAAADTEKRKGASRAAGGQ
jgi:preprotein translocase subunit YajC